jgi:group I intron endonuclease
MGRAYGIIYKATNTKNGKVYIGQTIRTLAERMRGHLTQARSKKTEKVSFQYAILKYGFDAFTWEVIDTGKSPEDLNQKEIEWISHYESFTDSKKGYNCTPGGSGGISKTIYQYDLNGKSLNVFDSLEGSKNHLNLKSSSKLRACCSGERNTSYKSVFLYENDYPTEQERQIEVKKRRVNQLLVGSMVIQLNKRGKVTGVYNSPNDAERKLGINRNQISTACRNGCPLMESYFLYGRSEMPKETRSNLEKKLEEYWEKIA